MITERAKVMLFFLLLSSQARAQNDGKYLVAKNIYLKGNLPFSLFRNIQLPFL